MVTLLCHGRQIAPVCQRVANEGKGKIQVLRDTRINSAKIEGTVIRWDSKHPVLADQTFNTAEAVRLSRNKKESRLAMSGLCPPTWTSWLHQRKLYQYPCIVRGRRHHAAQKFHVCNNLKEVEAALKRLGYQKWYISPIVPKELEYRIFVFQGRIIKCVRRWHTDPNQIAWNIAEGGKSVRLLRESWPIEACQAAILAGHRLKLDWFAADVIIDKKTNVPYVLELNTAPGLGQDKTFKRLAKLFIWADENPKPTIGKGNTWQDLIHPKFLKEKSEETEG